LGSTLPVAAVRAVSVERGVDPQGLALVAFGGAGPLHACALAEALGMPAVVVPPRAGVLSAVGILGAPRAETLVRSWSSPASTDGLEAALEALASEAARAVGPGAVAETAVDCRYPGQSHELTVPTVADFPDEHRRWNGYARAGAPVEVVALRATARMVTDLSLSLPRPAQSRRVAQGPAVLAEPDCTVWLPPGWRASVHESGSWVLTR
jgi:N-methylhydantoinase A/oxoprolinase/acetone carboxylase beta subunit